MNENLEKYLSELKAANNWIEGADIDERTRRTIKRACKAEIERVADEIEEQTMLERQGMPWAKSDIAMLEDHLRGRIADDWTTERETVDTISLRLRRSRKSVKKKAIELGYTRAVDYWYNRSGRA